METSNIIKKNLTVSASVHPSSGELTIMENTAGKFLKTKREEKKLSLRKLASKAHVSYAELSRIENGIAFPTPAMLRKLSPFLSVPYDELLFAVGYSFQSDSDEPVYLDLDGSAVNLFDKSLNLYTKDVELFFLIDKWLNGYIPEQAELVQQLLANLLLEKELKEKLKKNEVTEKEHSFFELMNSIRSLLHASNYFLLEQ